MPDQLTVCHAAPHPFFAGVFPFETRFPNGHESQSSTAKATLTKTRKKTVNVAVKKVILSCQKRCKCVLRSFLKVWIFRPSLVLDGFCDVRYRLYAKICWDAQGSTKVKKNTLLNSKQRFTWFLHNSLLHISHCFMCWSYTINQKNNKTSI